eukprot:TRINITY_DN1422_c0_g1_i4.p1 TRINITY_DN1422_c0_g1~~TRINITY_DN1422_c0_g1_i4.p1  ORF type:complete len:609 (+),score=133.68 TRINITY_DN1422_c0_g1_i4:821-2647(+)
MAEEEAKTEKAALHQHSRAAAIRGLLLAMHRNDNHTVARFVQSWRLNSVCGLYAAAQRQQEELQQAQLAMSEEEAEAEKAALHQHSRLAAMRGLLLAMHRSDRHLMQLLLHDWRSNLAHDKYLVSQAKLEDLMHTQLAMQDEAAALERASLRQRAMNASARLFAQAMDHSDKHSVAQQLHDWKTNLACDKYMAAQAELEQSLELRLSTQVEASSLEQAALHQRSRAAAMRGLLLAMHRNDNHTAARVLQLWRLNSVCSMYATAQRQQEKQQQAQLAMTKKKAETEKAALCQRSGDAAMRGLLLVMHRSDRHLMQLLLHDWRSNLARDKYLASQAKLEDLMHTQLAIQDEAAALERASLRQRAMNASARLFAQAMDHSDKHSVAQQLHDWKTNLACDKYMAAQAELEQSLELRLSTQVEASSLEQAALHQLESWGRAGGCTVSECLEVRDDFEQARSSSEPIAEVTRTPIRIARGGVIAREGSAAPAKQGCRDAWTDAWIATWRQAFSVSTSARVEDEHGCQQTCGSTVTAATFDGSPTDARTNIRGVGIPRKVWFHVRVDAHHLATTEAAGGPSGAHLASSDAPFDGAARTGCKIEHQSHAGGEHGRS